MDLQALLSYWNLENLVAGLRSWGIWAPLAAFALATLRSSLPFPLALPINIANGTLFGLWGGFALSWLGANIGTAVGFAIARRVGQPVVYRWLKGERWRRLEIWVRRRGFIAVFIGRLTPLVPYGPFSYVVGISPMPFRASALATLVGSAPGIFVGSAAGDLLRDAPLWVWLVGIGLYGTVSLLIMRRGQQQIDAAVAEDQQQASPVTVPEQV